MQARDEVLNWESARNGTFWYVSGSIDGQMEAMEDLGDLQSCDFEI